jgi:hypothetical protein
LTAGGRPASPAAVTSRLAASSSGAAGAQVCQAPITAAAWVCGQVRWKLVAAGSGSVRNTSEVTTPRLPPPAPRSAQNSSWSWWSSQSTTRPSASTTRAASRWSQVSPCVRPRIPSPPPSVSPAIPTVGPQPAGMVSSCAASASYTSPSRAPAPILAWPPSTDTERMGRVSTTIPSVEERPAKQCPPLRAAVGSPVRRASAIVSATSSGVAQRTTARGRTSWKRAMAGLRASS